MKKRYRYCKCDKSINYFCQFVDFESWKYFSADTKRNKRNGKNKEKKEDKIEFVLSLHLKLKRVFLSLSFSAPLALYLASFEQKCTAPKLNSVNVCLFAVINFYVVRVKFAFRILHIYSLSFRLSVPVFSFALSTLFFLILFLSCVFIFIFLFFLFHFSFSKIKLQSPKKSTRSFLSWK